MLMSASEEHELVAGNATASQEHELVAGDATASQEHELVAGGADELAIMRRLAAAGGRALSDGDLVAVLLSVSCASGQRVAERMGGARGVARAGLGELCAVGGIEAARAARLKAAVELGRRALDAPIERGVSVRRPTEV